MSFLPSDRDRHVVPRWRPSIHRASSLELAPVREKVREVERDPDFVDREQDFQREKSLWTAADLVSSAVARGLSGPTVREAVALLESSAQLTPALRRMLSRNSKREQNLGSDVPQIDLNDLDQEASHRVAALREGLRAHPRSALKWMDIALAHVTLGNSDAALRAVRTSLSLAPANRSVLRSAARFFVHIGEADQALYWLGKSERTRRDPWLLAAHVAVSQFIEKPIQHIRTARELLSDNSISPISASELSAAVASEELRAGKQKQARVFMASALRDPTENAVAQAVWSIDHGLGGFDFDREAAPRAFEATTLAAMQASNWKLAHSAAQAWMGDEPFSARAALHASYIATTGLEDYAKALEYASIGLRTSPHNALLLNNAAFALSNLGRTRDAFALLDLARTDDSNVASMLEATRGLSYFRTGEIVLGRELYRAATEQFRKRGSAELVALCQVMWAREEIRSGTDVGDRIFTEASSLVTIGKSRDARVWMERIRKQLRSAD